MIEFEASPGRLDRVVAEQLRVSRADAQRAIEAGGVLVDGVLRRRKSFPLVGGERIRADLSMVLGVPPDPSPVRVLFEDDHLAVVSKPAGVPTHPTASRRTGTLVNRLLGMGMPLAGNDPLRPGIVHRLDAGTSGLLVVAKSEAALEGLRTIMRRHEAERVYVALVRGRGLPDRFLVDAPLERRKGRVVVRRATGRSAETEGEVRERFARATLIELRPRTGRTHQIRAHCASIGHPILGDTRYGGGGEEAVALGLRRPFLHAYRLAFSHPVTGERLSFEDPLPEDLTGALKRVRLGG